MAFNRQIWKREFNVNNVPHGTCPSCNIGLLELVPNTLRHKETERSSKLHSDNEWEPEFTEYAFTATFQCNNQKCKETICSCGEGYVDNKSDIDEDGNWDGRYEDVFRPKYFYPSLEIFVVPEKCLREVTSEIRKSFALFFCDPQSAGNHLRIATENLLTHLGIAQHTINKKHKRVRLSLHARIERLATNNKDLGDKLMAIKWVGNAGSHSGELTANDVLDMYTIVEDVTTELFSGNQKILNALVKKINKAKGTAK